MSEGMAKTPRKPYISMAIRLIPWLCTPTYETGMPAIQAKLGFAIPDLYSS